MEHDVNLLQKGSSAQASADKRAARLNPLSCICAMARGQWEVKGWKYHLMFLKRGLKGHLFPASLQPKDISNCLRNSDSMNMINVKDIHFTGNNRTWA